MAWVYILRCSDDSLYVGHTTDLVERVRTHDEGKGGGYTAKRRPVRLAYSEELETLAAAITRERQLKGWATAKKEALIRRDFAQLKLLSTGQGPRRRGRGLKIFSA